MTAELDRYQPTNGAVIPITGGTALAPLPPANDVDGWIQVIAQVAALAERISDTDFVPDALRRKPAAVTAAILAGREMGVAPMTSLQHINVIKGKPGQDAMLMRALVLSKGHQLEYGDCNDSRALVRGKRRGEETWTEVVFTAEQARKARIDLGGYPEDKLIARATSRLCRRKFADVISGLSYTLEELQDGDVEFVTGDEQGDTSAAAAIEAPTERTAQRRSATRRTRKPAEKPAEQDAPKDETPAEPPAGRPRSTERPPAAEQPASSGPPLPGEDGYDDQGPKDSPPMSDAQKRLMFKLFGEAEVSDRDEQIHLASLLLERDVTSRGGFTVAEASTVIDALSQLKASGHAEGLPGAVNDMLNLAALREAEQEKASAGEPEQQGPADHADDAAAEQ